MLPYPIALHDGFSSNGTRLHISFLPELITVTSNDSLNKISGLVESNEAFLKFIIRF
jgi:hypothetical protein